MGCANSRQSSKKSQKSKKDSQQHHHQHQQQQQILLTKQIPKSSIVSVSNVDSKYGSKIMQQPNSTMAKQILLAGLANSNVIGGTGGASSAAPAAATGANSSVLTSQIQPSQFDSKYQSNNASIFSTISSQGAGSSMLGSQLNPSDYQASSAFGTQSSYGGSAISSMATYGGSSNSVLSNDSGVSSMAGSNVYSSMAGTSVYSSMAPGSKIGGADGSSVVAGSNVASSTAGSTAYASSFAPGKDTNSNFIVSDISKAGDGSNFISTHSIPDPTSKLGPEKQAINISVAISKGPTTTTIQQQPKIFKIANNEINILDNNNNNSKSTVKLSTTIDSNVQKLYTPSQIYSKFLDEKALTASTTAGVIDKSSTSSKTTLITKQPIAKFSKV